MDHFTVGLARAQQHLPIGPPAAPSPAALPLPASPPPGPSPARDPPSEVSYESFSLSDRSVFDRKVQRYQDWTENVTREGGVDVSESSFGRAAGVGSASWGSLPTIKALSRDGTEPSTIVDQRHRARRALKHPNVHTPMRLIHYTPLVFPPDAPARQTTLPEVVPRPVVASRIVDTPAAMTSLDLLSPTDSGPLPNHVPSVPQKALSRQPSHTNEGRPSPSPQRQVSRQASRTEMRRPTLTPYLANSQPFVPQVDEPAPGPSSRPLSPPSQSQQNLTIPAAIGNDRPSSGHSGHSTHSAYREREAYLNSALHLPLDMLSEKQSAPAPSTRRNSIKRWTSLIRRRSRQPQSTEVARQPRVLSGPEATLPSLGGSILRKKPSDKRKDASTQLTRSHTIGASASKDKGKAKEATMSSVSLPAKEKSSLRSQYSIRKPLPQIAPKVTVTSALGSASRQDEEEVLATPQRRPVQDNEALQLDPGHSRGIPQLAPSRQSHQTDTVPALGSANSRRSARPPQTQAPQTTSTQLRHPTGTNRPTQSKERTAPHGSTAHPLHRQQLPLPRPALSRGVSSVDGLTKTLGRRHRDPSLTNLTARFEPEMYSLPDSALTGDERMESPIKKPQSTGQPQSHNHPLKGPAAPHPSLAAHRAKTIESVQVTPELLHPQPQSAIPARLPGSNPPHATTTHRDQLRSPVRVTSPSERREVQFSPQNRHRDDGEEVRFEVPSRSNGRLRVSVAWLRDRQGTVESNIDSHGSPPPVPPKFPASLVDRFRRRDHEAASSLLASQPHSPPPAGRTLFNPFWANGHLPAYSPPPLPQVYQLQPGMAYPQLAVPYNPWNHPGQAYQQPPKNHRPASPPRPPSVDPPSTQGSPAAKPAGVPHLPAPYPGQPGMPWYHQPTHAAPSQHPGVPGYASRKRGGPTFWQKMFKGRGDDEDPINDWRRSARQAPPTPPTVMSRGPITAPLYRNPGYPRTQRTAWWRLPPASAWSDDHHTVAQEEYRRREEMQRYDSQRRRDGRRPGRGSGGSVWDIFRRRTDEVYVRSPPRRNAPLPPPAPSTHLAPVRSPVRPQAAARNPYPQSGPSRRPGIAQKWSSRLMNGNSGLNRVPRQPRPAQNGFLSHDERQKAKEQRREYKRQRREAREQRRQVYARRERDTNGGFFSGRVMEGGRSRLSDSRGRDGVRGQRNGRGRDMGMVGDWARGISRLLREPDRSTRYARGNAK